MAGLRAGVYNIRVRRLDKAAIAKKAIVDAERCNGEKWAEIQLKHHLELARSELRTHYAAGMRSLFERRNDTTVYARIQPIVARLLLFHDTEAA